jgi:ribosomal protein S18 acetylase RimI-like enzyme
MTPRLLTAADLPAAHSLLARAGLGGGVAYVARYQRWYPEGMWGSFDERGELAGMVTVLQYGPVGFVGCMAVAPELQGRGIGRRLLEHAHAAGRARGIGTFLLEATPSGQLLYEKLGYRVEHESAILGRPADAVRFIDPAPLAADRAAVHALDREATGCARATLIDALVDNFAGAAVRVRGELAGFGFAVGERLGPVTARDPGAGRELVDRLAPGCTSATVPLDNEPAAAALAGAGFTELRRIVRMSLGPAVRVRLPWVWSLVSAGAG